MELVSRTRNDFCQWAARAAAEQVFHKMKKDSAFSILENKATWVTWRSRPGFWRRLARSVRKRRKKWAAAWGFNADWYRANYADVREAGFEPLTHYIEYGQKEGRYKNPLMRKDQELDRAHFHCFRQEKSKRASKVIGILPERLTDSSLSPCAYIRLLLPIHFLAETSKDYRIEILDENSIFLKKADIVICQRFWCQEQHRGNQILREIKRRGIKVIYDLDDDLLTTRIILCKSLLDSKPSHSHTLQHYLALAYDKIVTNAVLHKRFQV
jgi:hypothetical protein